MGNYLLFAEDTYYPAGAKNDFVGRFETFDLALEEGAKRHWNDVVTIMDLTDNSFREYYFKNDQLVEWPRA